MRFKAKVCRWLHLPTSDVCNLLSWLPRSRSTFETDNPNVLVARASDERGDAMGYVCAEPTLIVTGYAVRPKTTPLEAAQAGDAMDVALCAAAQESGVQRVFLVLPDNAPHQPDEQCVRIIERRIAPAVESFQQKIDRFMQQPAATTLIN